MKQDLPACGGGEAAEAGLVGGGVSVLGVVDGVAGTASVGVFLVGAASVGVACKGACSVGVDREGACSVDVDREGACSVGSEKPPPARSATRWKNKFTNSLCAIEPSAEKSMLHSQAFRIVFENIEMLVLWYRYCIPSWGPKCTLPISRCASQL